MKINSIMSKDLVVLNKDSSISDVAKVMKEKNIGMVLINDSNRIIGVITDRDIVINCIANECDINDKVEQYINSGIITVDINENIDEVLNVMSDNKIKRVIITDDKKVIGVISISDMLNDDNSRILDVIKNIWSIDHTIKNIDCEIDEFYL